MNSYNKFGVAQKVAPTKFEGFKANDSRLVVTMPSKSIACLEIVMK